MACSKTNVLADSTLPISKIVFFCQALFINFPDPTAKRTLTVIFRISQVPIKKLLHMHRVFDSVKPNRDSR